MRQSRVSLGSIQGEQTNNLSLRFHMPRVRSISMPGSILIPIARVYLMQSSFKSIIGPLIGALFKKDKWRKDEGKKASQPLGWAGNEGFLLGLTLSTIGYVCQIN